MQEQTCQDSTLDMPDEQTVERVVSARDKATEAYSGVVSTPRNEPDAFKRQCFRDGWDAAIASMPDTNALDAADALADALEKWVVHGSIGVLIADFRAARATKL